MARLLIVYGTTDGHTRKIAEAVQDYVLAFGHMAVVMNAARHPVLRAADRWDGVIVCAPLRRRRHPAAVVRFVRDNRERLAHLPTVFFSVSLAAAGNDLAGARACVDEFLAETGWHPGMVRLVAGALLYTRYNWLVRWIMRRIARANGGDTDTSRDYDYTDWQRLREDVEEFVLGAVPAGRVAGGRLVSV
ncbi:MAG TPA: flavodoxin domain-containing protein [Longimicrobium sp.]|nr:flavodoxin domain-containing protein [Longimicrobium sp.]